MTKIEEYVGKKYNSLVILSDAGSDKKYRLVNVICDCGNKTVEKITYVIRGKKKSCGCKQNKTINNHKHQKIDTEMIGKKFNNLTVIKKLDIRLADSIAYECRCDCGNTKITSGARLRRKDVKSCGCLKKIPQESFEHLYKTYIRSAKKRKLVWEITEKQFKDITSSIVRALSMPSKFSKPNS